MTSAQDHRQEEIARPRGAVAKIRAILEQARADRAGIGQKGGEVSRVTVGELFDMMAERAYGLLLLLLALPCCLPFVYGLPQIVALPMLLLAGQMAMGRPSPWLPSGLRERSFEVDAISRVIDRAAPYVAKAEWLAHARLLPVTGHVGSRLVGAALLIPCGSILVPLPLTNTVPGIAVGIAAVGMIERDGLFVIGGLLMGFAWVGLLLLGGQAVISAIAEMVVGG